MMKRRPVLLATLIFAGPLAILHSLADESAGAIDHVSLSESRLDADLPIRIKRFSVDGAKLGRAKHADTARLVREHAAGMLLVDIIEELRDGGFAQVAEFDAAETVSGEHYVVSGEFTELNPGSQSARVLWGFGAGKSKVCISGEVRRNSGAVAGTFRSCDNGLGWGDSQDQLEGEVDRLGVSLGKFLVVWSRR